MKTRFLLNWSASSSAIRKAFKAASAHELFMDYIDRINRFQSCEVKAVPDLHRLASDKNTRLWICDRSGADQIMSSDQLADQLNRVMNMGVKCHDILIGGPDGFTKQTLEQIAPHKIWSFGPLTYPHELAAVVAAEQMYRAFTILRKQPYHCGH